MYEITIAFCAIPNWYLGCNDSVWLALYLHAACVEPANSFSSDLWEVYWQVSSDSLQLRKAYAFTREIIIWVVPLASQLCLAFPSWCYHATFHHDSTFCLVQLMVLSLVSVDFSKLLQACPACGNLRIYQHVLEALKSIGPSALRAQEFLSLSRKKCDDGGKPMSIKFRPGKLDRL